MRIVIWTGAAWETWGPGSLQTGIGGSEAAAVYLSRELARLGHEVEVAGQVTPGEVQGVRYVDYREYLRGESPVTPARKMECDVFVSSRDLRAADVLRPDARLRVLWAHDAHSGPDPSGAMNKYDVVLCLSDWALHLLRRFYPHVAPEKFVRTRNGIDVALYREAPRREGFRVVYSSSPDRGLDKLLDYWPAVREGRPDAELHVYYGFDTWERMAERSRDAVAAASIQIFRTRLANMAEQGVTSHGRVGQDELAAAWLRASAWLYPTNFCETSCITAMEAQAAGVPCVCTRLAALPETARSAYLVDPPNTREGYRAEFLEHAERIARLLQTCGFGTDLLVDRMGEGREWALAELGWDGVASQWDEIFRERLAK